MQKDALLFTSGCVKSSLQLDFDERQENAPERRKHRRQNNVGHGKRNYMGRQRLRKIVVDGTEFLWCLGASFVKTSMRNEPYQRLYTFTAHSAEHATSPVRIRFLTWEDAATGGPLHHGETNLAHPKWAAPLIRMALRGGWQPDTRSRPFTIQDGMPLLAELGFDVQKLLPASERQAQMPDVEAEK